MKQYKLSTAELDMVLHGLNCSMQDYPENEYLTSYEKEVARVKKYNAKLQKVYNKLVKQYQK